jgi:hypothetical protein
MHRRLFVSSGKLVGVEFDLNGLLLSTIISGSGFFLAEEVDFFSSFLR